MSGTVKDDKQQPLASVSVMVKDSKLGTITDEQGHYSIQNVPAGATLVFSYTGYPAQEIRLTNQPSIDVVMTASSSDMNEVVVIGYGTARRKDLTGAVASVQATKLEKEAPDRCRISCGEMQLVWLSVKVTLAIPPVVTPIYWCVDLVRSKQAVIR
ncbi:carboxypeptidase-like regulatory domain-containing protein [Niabella hibiscisoli]|uniref:carboxypeptidase-like regulatory domain-containing protein n=1 Tax=Niabella hibiscisoli TaxID=1825928 RepID=UPI001F0F97D1|nr:carboxypeptidase-like regulatory domain-containing protein [Niabella hibiscisoli]MCH5717278.1 carboxypeptidase-like regulatory domain-containing protein [Niabella hibiscisoli]